MQIFDIALDNTGFDLYTTEAQEAGVAAPHRRTSIKFEELSRDGHLFFSARRGVMEKTDDLMEKNPGAHNTVGRHAAGFHL